MQEEAERGASEHKPRPSKKGTAFSKSAPEEPSGDPFCMFSLLLSLSFRMCSLLVLVCAPLSPSLHKLKNIIDNLHP